MSKQKEKSKATASYEDVAAFNLDTWTVTFRSRSWIGPSPVKKFEDKVEITDSGLKFISAKKQLEEFISRDKYEFPDNKRSNTYILGDFNVNVFPASKLQRYEIKSEHITRTEVYIKQNGEWQELPYDMWKDEAEYVWK